MVRKLIENRIVGNMRAVANEHDDFYGLNLCRMLLSAHPKGYGFGRQIEYRPNGDIVVWAGAERFGCLGGNVKAITIRYDNQTGKFVEVEHDEARASEAYEIWRVLNLGV